MRERKTNMIKAKCIKEYKNKQNEVYAYILEDVDNVDDKSSTKGKKIGFFKEDLKQHIRDGKIKVTNLEFEDVDDKLSTKKKENIQDKIINRAIVMGLRVDDINLVLGEKCYAIHNDSNTITWYIPNHIKYLTYTDDTKDIIKNFKGNLRLMGGESLTGLDYLFYKSDLQSIDFTKFKPKQIKSLNGMFEGSHIKEINISNLNIAKDASKNQLFYLCHTTSIKAESVYNITMNDIENNIFGDCGIPIKLNAETYIKLAKDLVKKIKEQTDGLINIEIKEIDNVSTEITCYKKNKQVACRAKVDNEICLKHLLTLYDEINYTEIMESFNNIIETIEMHRPIYYSVYENKMNEPMYKDITNGENHTLKGFKAIKKNNYLVNNTGITLSSLDTNLRFGLYQLDTGEWTVKDINLIKIGNYLRSVLLMYNEVIEKTDEEIERTINYYKAVMTDLNQQMRHLESMKEYYRSKGVDIQISGKIIVDGILEDLRKLGYSEKVIIVRFEDNMKYKEFRLDNDNMIYQVKTFLHNLDKVASLAKRGEMLSLLNIEMWG